ncbi:YceD family protein [Roseateles sp. BYS180W]|uniref:Large ribosomal RNA subunit accumulation protein YceD n=1 Tax=Roseateles rivi TaxID=3299028 RepID=A0ABW7FS86_9BURK
MKDRVFDPQRLDIEAFARQSGVAQGSWDTQTLQRLRELAAPDYTHPWPALAWQLEGECITPRGADAQYWLRLTAQTEVPLTCQHCLQPVLQQLDVERRFRFVRDEALAAELDLDSEHEVLSYTGNVDALELVEDELLLALPLVPRHDQCQEPLSHHDELPEEAEAEAAPHPFAVLAALKKDK